MTARIQTTHSCKRNLS